MFLTSCHSVRLASILLTLIHIGQARKGKSLQEIQNQSKYWNENNQTSDSFGISCGYCKPTIDKHLIHLFQTHLSFCMKDLHFSTLNSTFAIYIQLSEAQNNIQDLTNCKFSWLILSSFESKTGTFIMNF